MESVGDIEALKRAFAAPRYLLFKHSTACPISARALEEVESFLRDRADLEAGLVDVIQHRAISSAVEERTGVRHESPQAFLLEGGKVAWHASHYSIRETALAKAVDPS